MTLEKICKAVFQCISIKPTMSVILEEIHATDVVRGTWDKLSDDSNYELFDELVHSYAKLRIKAYAESFNYLTMKRSRINKSLRKSLD